MMTKQELIRWIEGLPEENIKTAVVLLDGEKQISSKIEGTLGNICVLLSGTALHCVDFGEAIHQTSGFLKWKGGKE